MFFFYERCLALGLLRLQFVGPWFVYYLSVFVLLLGCDVFYGYLFVRWAPRVVRATFFGSQWVFVAICANGCYWSLYSFLVRVRFFLVLLVLPYKGLFFCREDWARCFLFECVLGVELVEGLRFE